jgi:MFS family permease
VASFFSSLLAEYRGTGVTKNVNTVAAGVPPGGRLSELTERRRRLLVVSSIGVFMATLDSSILAVALPQVSADLRLSFSAALWVQVSYLLVVTVLLIPVARWGEKRGMFFVYWVGNLIFALFSIATGFAFDGAFLIGARLGQAVGGAFVVATSAAIVAAAFPPQERGRALGLNMMGSTLGQTFGPPVGGLIVAHLGWQWIFFIKVPVALVTLVAGWDLLGAERRDLAAKAREVSAAATAASVSGDRPAGGPAGRNSIDYRGAGLLALLLAALFVPLIFSPLWGWASPGVVAPLVCAIGIAAVFVYAENRSTDPILDLRLFKRSRVFTTSNIASLLYMAGAYGVTIFTAVFLEVVQGRSAQVTGLVLLAQPAVASLGSPIAGRLSDRFGPHGLSAAGMLVMAAGTVQLGLLNADSSVATVALALATLGLGVGVFSTPNFSAIMGSVDRSQLGVASGMFTTSRFCGMGISVAVLGAIAASKLGPAGGRVILLGAKAGVDNAQAFAAGYREAMFFGTGFALVGVFVSLIRERRGPQQGSAQA